jgi:hypothetical protein
MFYKKSFPAVVITLAVVALSLGGLGGSMQLSRLFLILLVPVILVRYGRVVKIKVRSHSFPQVVFPFLLILMGALSLVWSIDKLKSLGYLLVLSINLLSLLMLALMSEPEIAYLRRQLPNAWLLAASVILPVALYELTTGDHFSLGLQQRGTDMFSVLPFASGLHGNFNDFSLFLVFCAFGICLMDRSSNSITLKTYSYMVLTVIAGVIVINGSRGAILTLACLLMASFYRAIFSKIGLLILLVCVVAYSVTSVGSRLDENLMTQYLLLKFTDFSNDMGNDEGRYNIALAGIEGIITSVGLGVGAGASSVYLDSVPSVGIPNPHNLFLELGLNFGVPGLALFIWFLSRMWRTASQRTISESRPVIICFILLMPIFGLIQSHLTGYTYFWLALATAAVCGFSKEVATIEWRAIR